MRRKQRELTMTVETTENTSTILTKVLLDILRRHPELAEVEDGSSDETE